MLFERNNKTVNLLGTELPEPRVFLDFLGFEKHMRQIRDKRGAVVPPSWYDHPAYYIVDITPEKVFGHGDEVHIPPAVKAGDYEFEIGCYVTKSAVVTSLEEAVAFFKENCWITIVNDWSARDIQKKDMEGLGPANSKFIIGNSMGPKFVRASEFKMDENGVMDMEMILHVNGKERSRTNYNTLYHTHPTSGQKAAWSFPRIFTFLGSENIAVHPGYLFGSGTVGNGCIAEFMAKVDPVTGQELAPATYPWLQDGDIVTMEVKGIGVLENKVRVGAKQFAAVK
ncbi:MAG TPA: fumarylacetoacetate hydrolase family protein [Trichormus sp.]|jgi:2-keto-4-pentenoate hydratase/2-oxohepta-3-ene-1,7-dioic acid hydratase in catechol pathway